MGAGLGDDSATVGVAREDHRVALGVDDTLRRGDVVLEREGCVLHHADLVAVLLEQVVYPLPAGSVDEAAVHENDVNRRWACIHPVCSLFREP